MYLFFENQAYGLVKLIIILEMPVKNQLQGMLAVFEPLDRAQSKKNFEPSFVKIG
jgi:hypothetical protein